MNGNYLLDTNIVIAILNGDPSVNDRVAEESRHFFISTTVIGELYYGAYKSQNTEANLARLQNFIVGKAILDCNLETSRHYGQIKNELRGKGQPLPENDIWIAAIACQYRLILVSRDRHFHEVEGVSVETW